VEAYGLTHVLVTGGAGFIGSHLVDAYIERGWRVTVIDNLSTGDRANLNPNAEFIEADLRDPATADHVTRLKPDVVNHQAAQVDVRISVSDPGGDAETNVVASVRLMQKAHEAGVKRFIFASSGGAAYGEPLFAPQTEEHPMNPMSPYGCAKAAVELYMNCFRQVHGLRTVALRYANVYGPRQSTKGEAGVIALFIDRLLKGQGVTINGSGEQTRDFVFVGDVVAANMAITTLDDPAPAFNVGTGVETSVNALYEAIAGVVPATIKPVHGPGKPGEQIRSVLDGSRLRKRAGLPAPVALGEGLLATATYFQERDART
jgi:UDP-glucose 4-epimerase